MRRRQVQFRKQSEKGGALASPDLDCPRRLTPGTTLASAAASTI
jgi:hypothetical protein